MDIKNKLAALTVLAVFNFANVEAAAIDEELAVIAAEQEIDDSQNKKTVTEKVTQEKSKRELKAEEKRLKQEKKAMEKQQKEEMKAAEKEVRESQKNSKDKDKAQLKISERDSMQKNFPTVDPVAPKSETVKLEKPVVHEPEVETFTPQQQNSTPPQVTTQPAQNPAPAVNLPNPIVMYSNFEELANAVNFTPLYIPKKSGFSINSMMAIDGRTAEIRYGRRWEPEVSLHIRTYKRMNGEELQDISGVHGVKWRVDMTSGTSIYIAKIDENKHVAAWAAGNYTFSAQSENLSFAAFHAIVADELVDLSNHYYIN